MSQASEVNAILDELGGSATFDEVEYALRDYGKRLILDVLADRALSATGGAALTVTGDTGSVPDVTTLNLAGSSVAQTSPGVAEATVSVPVLSTRVPLTHAQILALPSAPTELVPAPGADRMIVPLSVLFRCDTLNDGYDNIDALAGIYVGPAVAQTLISSLAETVNNAVSDLFGAFDDVFSLLVPVFETPDAVTHQAGILSMEDYIDSPLLLIVDNQAAGNFTAGNALNTASITTLYMVVDL